MKKTIVFMSVVCLMTVVVIGCSSNTTKIGEKDDLSGNPDEQTGDAEKADTAGTDNAGTDTTGVDTAGVDADLLGVDTVGQDTAGTPDLQTEDADGVQQNEGETSDTATVSDADLPKFSFFVTSLKVMQELSNNDKGFGGDLRYGETGAGAGLRGADKICTTIAEKSMPGSGVKVWRAFLSVTADENGKQVNAIDRIGNGPWYDRLGRLFAPDKASLMYDRPQGGDATIRDDFPNEDGVPNHRPDTTQPQVDNHDFLTGTNDKGQLYGKTATCSDWTSVSKTGSKPRVGHSWPRSGGGPGGNDMANWMSALDEYGCAPGVHLIDDGPGVNDGTVGGGGGYGGIYCFALQP